jgi:TPR repeat protein
LTLLEEQCQRHEAEISMYLERRESSYTAPLEILQARLAQLEQRVRSEQLYRQGQELLFGERGLERNCIVGLSRLKESAALGHAEAALSCGLLCEEGRIGPKNTEEAARLFRVSAMGGNALGQAKYGSCLFFGTGVANNGPEAAKYAKLSADQGSASGQCCYGHCLRHGIGIAQHLAEAVRYYRLSADQGNASGQSNYGVCLETGKGIARNVGEAVKYYKRAADQGGAHGQFMYGRCLRDGIGTPRDQESAARYLALARAQGVEEVVAKTNHQFCPFCRFHGSSFDHFHECQACRPNPYRRLADPGSRAHLPRERSPV